MSNIHVDIVSAEGNIYSGEATMVFAPAEMGEVGIAPRHAPLITRIKPGTVRVKTATEELPFFVGGGILEVQPHLVTVMADTALRAKDADEAAAQAAKTSAEERLAGAKTDIDIARVQAELVEAAARLKFVQDLKKTSR
ncbi:F0F1 ATP synthase subunit epsilon [Stagnimonas aquatica]|uniref:ATP synthase epsilon chain n=1 Tax=Stagnimonas aquatica TaxID=2689987 RepID=A0A3N0V7Z7_9GAMM|nr:F0F1 ATP synthase subunit epsilon [Stagnimonas aquatica]ROH88751.1 F0F1 ATP synthase subunit epsilon [Stagnimonas aquatica]